MEHLDSLKSLKIITLLFVLFCAVNVSADFQLIPNGSFETGDFNHWMPPYCYYSGNIVTGVLNCAHSPYGEMDNNVIFDDNAPHGDHIAKLYMGTGTW